MTRFVRHRLSITIQPTLLFFPCFIVFNSLVLVLVLIARANQRFFFSSFQGEMLTVETLTIEIHGLPVILMPSRSPRSNESYPKVKKYGIVQ